MAESPAQTMHAWAALRAERYAPKDPDQGDLLSMAFPPASTPTEMPEPETQEDPVAVKSDWIAPTKDWF
jgi:hypothetical protein